MPATKVTETNVPTRARTLPRQLVENSWLLVAVSGLIALWVM